MARKCQLPTHRRIGDPGIERVARIEIGSCFGKAERSRTLRHGVDVLQYNVSESDRDQRRYGLRGMSALEGKTLVKQVRAD